ncbi:hypothetical protein FNF28_01427 [Cafeteria roenbergensis]|uniref:UBC core domain-containing protein n=1 Tax=Cafeteria roenbergensis TaxID=33653 RepID=A0A5A8DY32_CAFRO|nr:hypothetical protein FNF28_01427 [Cafeteria roenbergensis]
MDWAFLTPSPPWEEEQEQWLEWTVRRTPREFSSGVQAGLDELRRFATSSLKCPDCGASIDRKSGEATRASKRGRPAVDRVIDLDEAESSAAASGKVFDLADDDSDGDGSDADQSGAERGGVVCVDEGEEEAAAGAALSQRSATAPQHDDDDDDDDGVVALDDSDDEGGAAPAAHGGVSLRTPRDAAPPPSVPADPADGGGADGGGVDNADARDDEASRSPSSAAAGATTTRAAAAAAAASTAPQLVLESSRTAPVIVCSVTRPMSPADVSSSAPAGSIAALLQTLSDAATLYCRTADAALEATADDATAFAADEAEQYTRAARAAGKTGEDSSPWIARVAFSPSDEAVAEYKRRMRPHAFAMVPRLAAAHAFRKSAAQSASRKQLKRLMRVATELSALPTTALEWASSVLARSDEARMDLVRVAVLGPADTPYMNGVALVDLMLPASYPDVPPQASFVSTAGGTVRFNPNLYANGKVCLSLLGTWTGPSWSPGQSTLAQVLLAIQGQIMNSNPWLNEPGFPAVPQLCSQYNCVLRLATLQHLILAPLRSPPPLFRQAVLTHFTLKQHELREQCASWTAEAARLARLQKGPCACQRYSVFPSDSPFNSSLMSVSIATRAACDQIRQLLDKLPPLSDEPC